MSTSPLLTNLRTPGVSLGAPASGAAAGKDNMKWILIGLAGCCCCMLLLSLLGFLLWYFFFRTTDTGDTTNTSGNSSSGNGSSGAGNAGGNTYVPPPPTTPTIGDFTSAAKTYYDTKGVWAGQYTMNTPVLGVKMVSPTVYDIFYGFTPVPGTAGYVGTDKRRFTYTSGYPPSVITMGETGSGASSF
jgi:hypothetical protein